MILKFFTRVAVFFTLSMFTITSFVPSHASQVTQLPPVGSMVNLTESFQPSLITGMSVNPENPLDIDFVLDLGDSNLSLRGSNNDRGNLSERQDRDGMTAEAQRLVNYFYASLTVPEDQMWVNLSPNEPDRIIPESLSQTEMGRDMLIQDYLLKQLSASLMHPEGEAGKLFWERVYESVIASEAKQSTAGLLQTEISEMQNNFHGSSRRLETPRDDVFDQLPDLFHKIWIVPESASVYVHNNNVFVSNSKLKVMMESDYVVQLQDESRKLQGLSFPRRRESKGYNSRDDQNMDLRLHGDDSNQQRTTSNSAKQLMKEILLPVIEQEVNEGKTFANLRQIYNSMILAAWYKKKLRKTAIGEAFVDQNFVGGLSDKSDRVISGKEDLSTDHLALNTINQIYNQYVESFKVGVYDFIREEYNPNTGEIYPKRYFSGGLESVQDVSNAQLSDLPELDPAQLRIVETATRVKEDSAQLKKNFFNEYKYELALGLILILSFWAVSPMIEFILKGPDQIEQLEEHIEAQKKYIELQNQHMDIMNESIIILEDYIEESEDQAQLSRSPVIQLFVSLVLTLVMSKFYLNWSEGQRLEMPEEYLEIFDDEVKRTKYRSLIHQIIEKKDFNDWEEAHLFVVRQYLEGQHKKEVDDWNQAKVYDRGWSSDEELDKRKRKTEPVESRLVKNQARTLSLEVLVQTAEQILKSDKAMMALSSLVLFQVIGSSLVFINFESFSFYGIAGVIILKIFFGLIYLSLKEIKLTGRRNLLFLPNPADLQQIMKLGENKLELHEGNQGLFRTVSFIHKYGETDWWKKQYSSYLFKLHEFDSLSNIEDSSEFHISLENIFKKIRKDFPDEFNEDPKKNSEIIDFLNQILEKKDLISILEEKKDKKVPDYIKNQISKKKEKENKSKKLTQNQLLKTNRQVLGYFYSTPKITKTKMSKNQIQKLKEAATAVLEHLKNNPHLVSMPIILSLRNNEITQIFKDKYSEKTEKQKWLDDIFGFNSFSLAEFDKFLEEQKKSSNFRYQRYREWLTKAEMVVNHVEWILGDGAKFKAKDKYYYLAYSILEKALEDVDSKVRLEALGVFYRSIYDKDLKSSYYQKQLNEIVYKKRQYENGKEIEIENASDGITILVYLRNLYLSKDYKKLNPWILGTFYQIAFNREAPEELRLTKDSTSLTKSLYPVDDRVNNDFAQLEEHFEYLVNIPNERNDYEDIYRLILYRARNQGWIGIEKYIKWLKNKQQLQMKYSSKSDGIIDENFILTEGVSPILGLDLLNKTAFNYIYFPDREKKLYLDRLIAPIFNALTSSWEVAKTFKTYQYWQEKGFRALVDLVGRDNLTAQIKFVLKNLTYDYDDDYTISKAKMFGSLESSGRIYITTGDRLLYGDLGLDFQKDGLDVLESLGFKIQKINEGDVENGREYEVQIGSGLTTPDYMLASYEFQEKSELTNRDLTLIFQLAAAFATQNNERAVVDLRFNRSLIIDLELYLKRFAQSSYRPTIDNLNRYLGGFKTYIENDIFLEFPKFKKPWETYLIQAVKDFQENREFYKFLKYFLQEQRIQSLNGQKIYIDAKSFKSTDDSDEGLTDNGVWRGSYENQLGIRILKKKNSKDSDYILGGEDIDDDFIISIDAPDSFFDKELSTTGFFTPTDAEKMKDEFYKRKYNFYLFFYGIILHMKIETDFLKNNIFKGIPFDQAWKFWEQSVVKTKNQRVQFIKKYQAILASDNAQLTQTPHTKGGIDFSDDAMLWQESGDEFNFEFPEIDFDPASLQNFSPKVFQILPVTQPMLNQMLGQAESSDDSNSADIQKFDLTAITHRFDAVGDSEVWI